MTVAALYVQRGGAYWNLPDIDPWPDPPTPQAALPVIVEKDARLYPGPWPVVAHPPCARWGRYWFGGPSWRGPRKVKGDDGGCFAAALRDVRLYGGVLEHPAASHAWEAFGLAAPLVGGGWIAADDCGGWTCHVEQGHYGHRARKATWLYANGVARPDLRWGPSVAVLTPNTKRMGAVGMMSHEERAATPPAFRDVLLGMARSVPQQRCA